MDLLGIDSWLERVESPRSLGVVLYELAVLHAPFSEAGDAPNGHVDHFTMATLISLRVKPWSIEALVNLLP